MPSNKPLPERSRHIPSASKWLKHRFQSKREDPMATQLSSDLAPLPQVEETLTEFDYGSEPIGAFVKSVEEKTTASIHHPLPHSRYNNSLFIPIPRSPSSSASGGSGNESLATLPTSFNATPPLRVDEDADGAMPPARLLSSKSVSSGRLNRARVISRQGSAASLRSTSTKPDNARVSSPVLPVGSPPLSPSGLLPLRIQDNADAESVRPVVGDDPLSFDLITKTDQPQPETRFDLEKHSQILFSSKHLWQVLSDTKLNREFATFLASKRPWRVPIFEYYTRTVKAIRALEYSNSLVSKVATVPNHPLTHKPIPPIRSPLLEKAAQQAFEELVRHDLPQFVAHAWIDMVSTTIRCRITGTLVPDLVDASTGLAEVFCLTDPSRPDNPIVMASREFSRTTQYGSSYVLGRNCRFLQGPHTSRPAVDRIREAIINKQSCLELLLNYRRDGNPFLNLLSIAPLTDDRGQVVYFIGAQIDVSNLARGAYGLEGFRRLIDGSVEPPRYQGEFKHLAEMFDAEELACVRKYGGTALWDSVGVDEGGLGIVRRHGGGGEGRVFIRDDPDPFATTGVERFPMAAAGGPNIDGKLNGVFQNFLLIRPAPSLRILFTSPSLRDEVELQSYFPDRLGGSKNVCNSVIDALESGREVTARVLWKVNAREGRARWIHCTPLFLTEGEGPNNVGAWMVVMVDDQHFQ